jgi:uncharacterized membrane protein
MSMVERLPFRWSYIIAPLVIFLLSVVLSAYFYHLLPAEVAVHFKVDGTPDRWLSREVTMVLALVPQVLLVLLAAAIAWGINKMVVRFWQPERTRTNLKTILLLMGNMIALPQLVLCFAMLDIFVYNAYQIHLLPLWIFALIIMVSGGVVMGMFFVRAIRQEWGARR